MIARFFLYNCESAVPILTYYLSEARAPRFLPSAREAARQSFIKSIEFVTSRKNCLIIWYLFFLFFGIFFVKICFTIDIYEKRNEQLRNCTARKEFKQCLQQQLKLHHRQ